VLRELGALPVREDALERGAVDVFHCDEVVPGVLSERVHLDDVRVGELRCGGGLAPEALDGLRAAAAEPLEDLERDPAVQRALRGFVDHPHPTAPDLTDDLEIADRLHVAHFHH
jgi:hypothetical protein